MLKHHDHGSWRDLFDLGIRAYYEGDPAAGIRACERLLAGKDLPRDYLEQTRRNLSFYARPLVELAPSTRILPLEIDVQPGWSQFNPSIAAAETGFVAIVRSSNYEMDDFMRYTIHDPEGIIRTVNYLVALDDALQVTGVRRLDDSAVVVEHPPFPVAGFEDCRLFFGDDAWRISATVRERNLAGICQIALLRIDEGGLRDLQLLNDAAAGVHEKNWMPVADGGDIRFVYSCTPTVILGANPDTGQTGVVADWPGPPLGEAFRGSSQLVPIPGGFLCLVHESADFTDGGRVYLHRFVAFDEALRITHHSRQFVFHRRGVEFCGGLAVRGEQVIASFGVHDKEAFLATLPLAEVMAMLAPAPEGEPVVVEPSWPVAPEMAGAGNDGISLAEPAAFTPAPRIARPKIVSVTIARDNAAVIAEALRGVVDWVDACVLVDTGSTDDTIAIARAIAGPKLDVRAFPWIDDFAAARNFALTAATEAGAEWAVILDTDERIDLGAVDIHTALARTTADVLFVPYTDGTYAKERFFRLPVVGQFVGATHEYWNHANGERATLNGASFDEAGKSPEQYAAKVARDITILTRMTASLPNDPRWWYYLGDALQGEKRYQEAIAAFDACARCQGWDEEGAWACYRAAQCWLALGNPGAAITSCAAGMAIHAGLAELPWLAGYAAWQAGKPAQTVWWARLSAALGWWEGDGERVPRVGFKHPPALFEGPYDLLRFALPAIGDGEGGAEAEADYQAAMTAREERFGSG